MAKLFNTVFVIILYVVLKQVSKYRIIILAAREGNILFLFYIVAIKYKNIHKWKDVRSLNAKCKSYLWFHKTVDFKIKMYCYNFNGDFKITVASACRPWK